MILIISLSLIVLIQVYKLMKMEGDCDKDFDLQEDYIKELQANITELESKLSKRTDKEEHDKSNK